MAAILRDHIVENIYCIGYGIGPTSLHLVSFKLRFNILLMKTSFNA